MNGLSELSVFEKEQFGSIRVKQIDGEPWFVAADVCRALGVVNHKDAIKRLDEDEKTGVVLTDPHGREQITNCVNEPGLYSLILGSRKPEARLFKRWITHEVIPAIRKTGSYSLSLSPAEQLVQQAQLLLEQERRMAVVEDKVDRLEAKLTTRPEDEFTVAGYANLHGIHLDLHTASVLGRQASRLSREGNYNIGHTFDPRFGTVNVYHVDILKNVFNMV